MFDKDMLGKPDLLGRVKVNIQAKVASQPKGETREPWPLEEVKQKASGAPPPSTLRMHIQWVPFDID